MKVRVNGEFQELAASASVADLLRELGLRSEQVAVERNRVLVRRAEHAATELVDGDEIEVVTLVGGG